MLFILPSEGTGMELTAASWGLNRLGCAPADRSLVDEIVPSDLAAVGSCMSHRPETFGLQE